MEQFSQSTSWTLAEDLRHLKRNHERSPHNQAGQKERREKEEQRKRDRTSASGWELKQKRGSCTWWSPLLLGKSRWERRGSLGCYSKESRATVWGRQDRVRPTGQTGVWCWNLAFRDETWERTLVGAGDGLRGQEWGNPQPGMYVEETLKRGVIVEWCERVGPFVASPLRHRPFLPRH